jgi:hypothetical protein
MKSRKVYVMLEVETTLDLKELRSVEFWTFRDIPLASDEFNIVQASANVARVAKRRRRAAPRSRRRKL